MASRYSGAVLGCAAAATALCVATLTDLGPDTAVARELAPPQAPRRALAEPVADDDRLIRIGVAILIGLEWSRR